MTLDNVKSLRENFKTNGLGIVLTNDNLQIFNSLDNFFIWDDTKELIAAIRVNNTRYRTTAPMEIIVTEYEHIQYMSSFIKTDKVNDLVTGLNMETGTPALITKIQDFIKNEIASSVVKDNKERTITNPMERDNTLPSDSFDDSTWVNVVYTTDAGQGLFGSFVMRNTDYFNYAPAALSAAQTYALSIGRRFNEWDMDEDTILKKINESPIGQGVSTLKITGSFKV